VLDVTGSSTLLDGPTVEEIPGRHSRKLGVDRARSYTSSSSTVGRSDFKFHVYTKTDFADPDTSYNFGENRASRKMIAWGGTYGRYWLYDLSRWTEAWTNNWYVDEHDLDGNGFEDYRMRYLGIYRWWLP